MFGDEIGFPATEEPKTERQTYTISKNNLHPVGMDSDSLMRVPSSGFIDFMDFKDEQLWPAQA